MEPGPSARVSAADGPRAHIIAINSHLAAFFGEIRIPTDRVSTIGPLLPSMMGEDPVGAPPGLVEFRRAHDPVILTVGSMQPDHDYLAIIRAFKEFQKDAPAAGLIIASCGARDGEYEHAVKDEADCVAADVMQVEDLTHQQLLDVMSWSDLMVRGYWAESYGLSRVEALMAGVPVVATMVGEQAFVTTYPSAM